MKHILTPPSHRSLRNLYSNNAVSSTFVPGAGYFLDPDMIQATGTEGGGSLSFDEARSQFVLWAAMKAPLILGANYALLATMRADQPEYFELLTHPEVIAIDQVRVRVVDSPRLAHISARWSRPHLCPLPPPARCAGPIACRAARPVHALVRADGNA